MTGHIYILMLNKTKGYGWTTATIVLLYYCEISLFVIYIESYIHQGWQG